MTTPLDKFLTEANVSDAEFGALIDKDRTTVNRIRNGKLRPTLDVAANIEAKTGGAVPMQAWTDLAHGALCATCERRAEDPTVTSCTRTDCGLHQREAA